MVANLRGGGRKHAVKICAGSDVPTARLVDPRREAMKTDELVLDLHVKTGELLGNSIGQQSGAHDDGAVIVSSSKRRKKKSL